MNCAHPVAFPASVENSVVPTTGTPHVSGTALAHSSLGVIIPTVAWSVCVAAVRPET